MRGKNHTIALPLDRLDLIAARFRVLSLGLLMADTGLTARIIWRKSRAQKRGFFACMASNGGPCREPKGSPDSR